MEQGTWGKMTISQKFYWGCLSVVTSLVSVIGYLEYDRRAAEKALPGLLAKAKMEAIADCKAEKEDLKKENHDIRERYYRELDRHEEETAQLRQYAFNLNKRKTHEKVY